MKSESEESYLKAEMAAVEASRSEEEARKYQSP